MNPEQPGHWVIARKAYGDDPKLSKCYEAYVLTRSGKTVGFDAVRTASALAVFQTHREASVFCSALNGEMPSEEVAINPYVIHGAVLDIFVDEEPDSRN